MKISRKHAIRVPWRLAVLLSVIVLFQTFLAPAAHAQNIEDRLVTVDISQGTVYDFFNQMKKQTGLDFIMAENNRMALPRITVKGKNITLRKALNTVMAQIHANYEIENGIVTVSNIDRGNRKVTGVVADDSGELLPGVHVIVKDGMQTVTDDQGRYTVTVPTSACSITFSYVGMARKTVSIGSGKSALKRNVTLENDNQISEVVVTGLMNRDAKTFTGNASVYKGDELKTVGHQNILKSLALLDPSLSLTENIDMGSDPNTMPEVRLRGESSFSGFKNIDKSGLQSDPNQPLFILDGYETTVERIVDLDMNRIESVTILKDAAAGAIYGARAANGVIVVKTKRPAEGQLKVSYNMDLDVTLPDLSSYDLLDAKENLQLINRLGLYRNNDGTLRPEYNEIAKWVAQGVNTDWLSQPLRNTLAMKHSLNLQGGDTRMRYGVDLNYANNPGVMKESKRDNYGIGVDLSYNFKDKLLFSNYLNAYQSNSTESPYGSFGDYTTINSFYPIYDSNGKLYKYYYYTNEYGSQSNLWGNVSNMPVNPLYEANVGNFDKSKQTNISDNFSFDWRILETLRLNGRLSYTKSHSQSDVFVSPNSSTYKDYGDGMSDVTTADQILRGKYTYTVTERESLEGNVFLTWAQSFDKHFITASAGTSLSDSKSTVTGFTAQGFGDGDSPSPAYAQGYEKGGVPNSAEGHARLASFFASANYAWNDRYLFDFSYRLDGSSEFGTKEKTAPFFSTGIGWNAHNEEFIRRLGFINMLKLRATYGEVGSVNFSPYQAKDIYNFTTNDRYDGNIGVTLAGLGNEHLRWQTTKSTDFGVNIGLFGRVDISADYYRKTTEDMVLPVTTPPSVGFSSFTDNLGRMRNQGYELALRAYIIKKPQLNVSLFANASHNENKILAISSYLESYNKSIDSSEGMSEAEYKQASHKFLTKYEEGQSSTAIYAVRSLGIDPMTGEELFLTREGKPTKTWSASDKVVVGDTEPTVRGTFGANVGWKGLYLNLTFSYQWGGQAYNQTLVDKVENSNKYQNVDKRVLTETWQKPGDVVSYKANITDRLTQSYTYASSRFVQDLNILQLSALSVQYELPKNWIQPLHMESIRLSFNTSDLMYLSTVKRERGTSYPYARAFTLGLRANF